MQASKDRITSFRPSLPLFAGVAVLVLGAAGCKCKERLYEPGYPTIESVTPPCDLVEGGASVVLAVPGVFEDSYHAATVRFGGREAGDVEVIDTGEIRCTVPEAEGPGVVDVELELVYSVPVRGPERCEPEIVERGATFPDGFEYIEGTRPVVSAVENRGASAPDPCVLMNDFGTLVEITSGCETGNELVYVLGSQFPEDCKVFFGSKRATEVIDFSSTQLLVLTPSGTAGEVVNVTVVSPGELCDVVSVDDVPFCYTQCGTAVPDPAAAEASHSVTGSNPRVAIGDVVGGAENDVVVASTTSGGGVVEVLQGDGTGALTLVHSVTLDGEPSDVVLADLDADGDLDAAVTLFDRDLVAVLANDGGFDAARTSLFGCGITEASKGILGPDRPAAVLALAIDGDGTLDLVVANSASGTVGILPGDGSGGFGPVVPQLVTVGLSGADPTTLAAADLDGDGDLDLVTGTGSNGAIVQLENQSAGSPFFAIVATPELPAPAPVVGTVLAAFFGTNDLVVVEDTPALHVMRLGAAGAFELDWSQDLATAGAAAVALGDVFGEDGMDLALACLPNVLQSIPAPPGSSPELVEVSVGSGTVVDVALGRLNSRDASTHDDAVLGVSDGRIVVVLNTGDGYD